MSDFWPGRNPTPEKRKQDKLAVRQIGNNAIPIMLQWISANDAKDDPLKAKMVTWISRHPWVPFRIESSTDKNLLAEAGFRILEKSQARSAVPALVEIVKAGGGESANDNVTFAMLALANLDPDAATKAGIQFGTNRWSGTNVIAIGWSAPPAAVNK
ncbi:MAG: hypothetical protein ABI042_00175 [Verrucomicrobiota bacterium]